MAQTRVLWLSASGHAVLKQYQCVAPPLDACLCRSFPAGSGGSEESKSSSGTLSAMDVAALAVLVSSDKLVLLMPNGETEELQLPYQMAKLYPSPFGLLIERKLSATLDTARDDNSNINISIDELVHLSDSDRIEWGIRNKMTFNSKEASSVAPKSSPSFTPVSRMSPLTLRSGRRINAIVQSSNSTPVSNSGRVSINNNNNNNNNNSVNNIPAYKSPVGASDTVVSKSHKGHIDESSFGELSKPTLFSLSSPAALLYPVNACNDGSNGHCFSSSSEDIVSVNADIVCSINRSSSRLSVWRLSKVPASSLTDISAHSLSIDTSRSTSMNNTTLVGALNQTGISASNTTSASIAMSSSSLGLGLPHARAESPFSPTVSFAPIPYTSQNLSAEVALCVSFMCCVRS